MDMINPSRVEDTSSKVQKCLSELGLQLYSSVDLMSFTSNFLESNEIGSGGCGKVYKGQLPKGILIAVKVLENIDVVEDTFMAEVGTMGKARHINLIKLYGYCFEDNMKALVYEYMENGSLDKILYENHHGNIEWVKLYDIAIDIANGLRYLHHDLEEQIIHCDIKAANVLLGKNFSAKLADFGFAKIMNRDVSRVDVSRIRGTYGYIAPEMYTPSWQVSCKCDVYSFGMMLFEILGKRKNGIAENWFPGLVWNQFENGNLEHFIQDCGIVEKDKENANILCEVALWCVQDNPDLRPSMENVVLMLKKERQVEDPPCPSVNFRQFSQVVDMRESRRENIERNRECSDKMELDPTYPQNIIVSSSYASVAGNGSRVALPQLKSNKCKTRSPNVLEEDLATLVPNKGMKLPTTDLVGKTTALNYKEIILQLIAKDEAITIGVWGMGGVGKTTIFKHVYNHLLVERNRFNKIIWVTVPKDSNITKLQDDLAKELDCKLSSEDDEDRRSRLLLRALEKSKRFLFFFDDMWTQISLDEIGIPEPTQENGFKLLLTTRKLDVCRRMGCHEENTIKVKPLPEDEAFELFMKKVGVLAPEVRNIAEMVAKKCSGLPLAICTVGGTMKGNSDISEWRVALNDLNLKDRSNRTMDIKDKVDECLKFSYNRLENEKQRKGFLCCVLYSGPILKRDLINFWIMDGIVEGINRQDELDKGQYVLNKLKDHCLLETVDEVYDYEFNEITDGVKMHDLIWDMAFCLTNKCFMVKHGSILKELPNAEEWERVLERASFRHNLITTISISPVCPNLSTLILYGGFLGSVTHNFFFHMKCLKVLDLHCDPRFVNSDLELLPDSISDLVNLRALRLSWYKKLKKLPSLAKLVLLRTLEFNNTGVKELPEGMEMLVNLRFLNLHGVQLKERIPTGLISKFSLLQELYLGGIEANKLYEYGSGECFSEELLSLKNLENLSVTFRCMSDYECYVGSPKFNGLKRFNLAIGIWIQKVEHYLGPHPQATIQLMYSPSFEYRPIFPQNAKRVEIECLFSCPDGMQAFEYDIDSGRREFRSNQKVYSPLKMVFGYLIEGVQKLEAFAISYCDIIDCIWSFKDENQEFTATGTSSTCWLRSLKMMQIIGCLKLYTIFEGIPISSGVICLKELEICYCHNLENIFPSSRLLQLLQNLEQIKIFGCNDLEELIGDEEENTETPIVAIPRLKYLWICDLPKLKRIWRGVMICDSLEYVFVDGCFKLKRLPRLMGEEQLTPPPTLKKIEGSREWWDSLEWEPAYPKHILEPFFTE